MTAAGASCRAVRALSTAPAECAKYKSHSGLHQLPPPCRLTSKVRPARHANLSINMKVELL